MERFHEKPFFLRAGRGPRRVLCALALGLCGLLIVPRFGAAPRAQSQPAQSPPAQSSPAQSPPAQSSPETARPRVAVMAFERVDVKEAESIAAEDQLRNELVKRRTYTVVDRAQTEKVLNELAFQQQGLTEQNKALQLGKLLNVQYIFTGRITALTGAVQLNVQMIEVQTAEILRSEAILHRGDMLGLIGEKVPLLAARMSRVERLADATPVTEPPPDLQRLADATPVTEPPPEPSPAVEKEEEGGMPWWGWALIGVGAVGIAASSSSDEGGSDSGSVDFSY